MALLGRTILKYAAAMSLVAAFCAGCASIGSPDGGRYDDDPPVFKGSSPDRNATNVKAKTITLDFDELIQIENAAEKVIVSPPMKEQADIQVMGKKIVIKLKDSLRANTTYSIDFADAIVDNNESNPLGDFCFSFATGDKLDTMEVSGYVLDASNLEPVKGIMVGVYSDTCDTSFTTRPLERVARTDANGHFVLRGLSDGHYRIYALQDMDQNYYFSQRGEMIAWSELDISPSAVAAVRSDTIWAGEDKIDTVLTVSYTRFLPDDIVLLAFREKPVIQYVTTRQRKTHEKFELTFAIPMDTLPIVRGLNFDETDAFIVDRNRTNDTLVYWMSDSTLYYRDTLRLSVQYPTVDSVGVTYQKTDTFAMVPAKLRAQVLKDAEKAAQREAEELEKQIKKLERSNDTIAIAKLLEPKQTFLPMTVDAVGEMDIDHIVSISFKEPVRPFVPDSVIHVYHKVDSILEPMQMVLLADSCDVKLFHLYAEWRPEEKYTIEVDSAGIEGIYGLKNKKASYDISIKKLDSYSTFVVNVQNSKPSYIAELFTGKDNVVRSAGLVDGSTVFYFLRPGKIFLRLFDDVNGNGIWDTGDFENGIRPEEVFYLNKTFELKANWDHEVEPWDVYGSPLYRQKPEEAKTASTEEKKKRESKNIERDEKIAQERAGKLQRKQDRKERRQSYRNKTAE